VLMVRMKVARQWCAENQIEIHSDDDFKTCEPLKNEIMTQIASIAKKQGFRTFEVPQDILIDITPFTAGNTKITLTNKT
jgi:hypothetical protein